MIERGCFGFRLMLLIAPRERSHPAALGDPRHPLASEAFAFKPFRLVATETGVES
jgi:hypothetical protein